jgi:Zn-dependent protease
MSAEPSNEGPDPFLAALDEDLYQKTCDVLNAPEPTGSVRTAWILLAVTLGLFVLSFLRSASLQSLGIIILVLLFHESGHFLGMRLFGYRNVRMFFIPFFGAAVSGRKHAAPVWQQAVVLLLGPLPGILVGLVLALTLDARSGTWVGDLVLWLIILNGFNLLPLVPLDGGRLLDLLLFSRRAALSAGFQVVACCGLAGLAWWAGSWIMGILAGLVLLTVPARYRKARLEWVFAGNPAQMPARIEELDDGQRRELFGWAVLLNRMTRTPAGLAEAMRELHEHMVSRPPRMGSWMALLLLYVGGWVAGLGGVLALGNNKTRHEEREGKRIAAELVADFQRTMDHIDSLRQQADRLAKTSKGDPAQAKQKKAEADHEWAELVARWRDQRPSVRDRAVNRLLTTVDMGRSQRAKDVLQLITALDFRPSE